MNNNNNNSATYAKLRDGSWGVRVAGEVMAGALVTVVKKSGETKQERIAKVLFSGDGVSICSIATGGNARPARLRRGCGCNADCCDSRCLCGSDCNCRGGPIFDC